MQNFRVFTTCVFVSFLPFLAQSANAKEIDEPSIPNSVSPTGNINDVIPNSEVEQQQALSKQLPTDNTTNVQQTMTKQETLDYLKNHPQDMEAVLSRLVLTLNAEPLKELLPIYATYPQHDQSIIDWGNAIIAMKRGDTKQAIALYRKLNAALPQNRTIHFQMASALYQDKQYKAAKSELLKIRSTLTNIEDVKAINQYITAIDKQDDWNFNVNLSFLNNDNLGNSPAENAKIDTGNGTITNSVKRQKGTGLGFNLGADKKWMLNDRWFTALHLNTDGSYYWDNKKYNDIAAGVGVGVGYRNSKTEIELSPNFNQRWYGGGLDNDNDDSLKKYTKTNALNLNVNHWFNPNWMYQNFSQYSKMEYEKPFTSNDGDYKVFSNTIMYLPNATSNFFGGFDYMSKDSDYDASESFTRRGMRVGWGQTWKKGYSTRATFGFAKKEYEGEDFFGYKRDNQEYSAGLSFWNRDFYILGLTPRLTYDYRKVKSNEAFENRNENNFNVVFTKTF